MKIFNHITAALILFNLTACTEVERQMNPIFPAGKPAPAGPGSSTVKPFNAQSKQNDGLSAEQRTRMLGTISHDAYKAARADIHNSRARSAARHKPYIYSYYKKGFFRPKEQAELFQMFTFWYNKEYDTYKPKADHESELRRLKQF